MMKTVQIYYIYDSSSKIRGKAKAQIEENINRITRALAFANCKTKVRLIGYRDRAFVGQPDKEADDAFYHFTGSSERILYHFGEGRLVSMRNLLRCFFDGIQNVLFSTLTVFAWSDPHVCFEAFREIRSAGKATKITDFCNAFFAG